MTEIVPAIDIIDGRCVRLTQGDYGEKKVYDASPLDMALRYADCGVKRIHMVDLDGAKASEPRNLKVLEQAASKSGLEIEWGGGMSSMTDIEKLAAVGMSKAIVGKAIYENRITLEDIRKWQLQNA